MTIIRKTLAHLSEMQWEAAKAATGGDNGLALAFAQYLDLDAEYDIHDNRAELDHELRAVNFEYLGHWTSRADYMRDHAIDQGEMTEDILTVWGEYIDWSRVARDEEQNGPTVFLNFEGCKDVYVFQQ